MPCKWYYSEDSCSEGNKCFFLHGPLESISEEVINALCLMVSGEDEKSDYGQPLLSLEGFEWLH